MKPYTRITAGVLIAVVAVSTFTGCRSGNRRRATYRTTQRPVLPPAQEPDVPAEPPAPPTGEPRLPILPNPSPMHGDDAERPALRLPPPAPPAGGAYRQPMSTESEQAWGRPVEQPQRPVRSASRERNSIVDKFRRAFRSRDAERQEDRRETTPDPGRSGQPLPAPETRRTPRPFPPPAPGVTGARGESTIRPASGSRFDERQPLRESGPVQLEGIEVWEEVESSAHRAPHPTERASILRTGAQRIISREHHTAIEPWPFAAPVETSSRSREDAIHAADPPSSLLLVVPRDSLEAGNDDVDLVEFTPPGS